MRSTEVSHPFVPSRQDVGFVGLVAGFDSGKILMYQRDPLDQFCKYKPHWNLGNYGGSATPSREKLHCAVDDLDKIVPHKRLVERWLNTVHVKRNARSLRDAAFVWRKLETFRFDSCPSSISLNGQYCSLRWVTSQTWIHWRWWWHRGPS
jgi:hypothetical protein